jgi:hypothetical protein
MLRSVILWMLCMLVWTTTSHADDIEDGRLWFMLNATGKLPAERWHWYAELQPRFREEASEFDQVLIRPAAYYALTERSSAWLGYAFVETDPAGRASFSEHRLWQQFMHNFAPIHGFSIQSRTRYEQRWIENSDDVGYKLRQLIRVTTPSSLHPKLTWVAWDEYFININSTDYGARKGFDQNRAFVGANWMFDNKQKLEIGYLNQYVNGRRVDAQNHVLSIMVNLFFD